ncbi:MULTISPECIES: DUF2164 domain-containing protein [Brevibacillus]|nr:MULTISPECIES: DUF2164 domain-containing protein [Brevibacillus]MEC2131602.1 DUF2164 domain-containing protein [Brevibacillus centrosporus]MED4907846.1 DUF2164 domain-containing protein [Brevibacillus centrosporus]RNB72093.1 DUF2164 domain-containing protein [Brevibacillus centrosporus]GED34448.1 hypothetical protein BCE02nite_55890 [Brevibacillus centrosporus]
MAEKMSREQKEYLVHQVQRFFHEQRGEELGNLETEEMIDFFWKQLGPILYNLGVQDARKLLQERFASLEDELYVLEKPSASGR